MRDELDVVVVPRCYFKIKLYQHQLFKKFHKKITNFFSAALRAAARRRSASRRCLFFFSLIKAFTFEKKNLIFENDVFDIYVYKKENIH